MGYKERKELYKIIEKERDSRMVVYITGDKRGFETQIHEEVLGFLINHLDVLDNYNKKISLFLYTRGGSTLAAWSIVNLLRQFCNELEVIVPSKAHSAGTLICLGANKIIMTKQSTLGPIDPNVNTPLNPHIPGAAENITFPVSVEAIKGYIELIKKELGVRKSSDLALIINALNSKIHPLVLGEVYRARSQIKMLAQKLLNQQNIDVKKINKIIDFLCSESGSHDYTINRKEAEQLGLKTETPSDTLYKLIKKAFDDIQEELELNSDFNPSIKIGSNNSASFSLKMALVESVMGGAHSFERNLIISKIQGQNILDSQIIFEGWKHEKP